MEAMADSYADGQPTQVLGERSTDRLQRPPDRWAIGVVALIVCATLALWGILRWATQPPDDELALRDFAAAVDAGDEESARSAIGDPTIISWPTYWSVLNIEHISPFGDRFGEFISFQHTLETETTIGACDSRSTRPDEPDEYDNWVRCDYVIRDGLSRRLEGPSASSAGRLSAGFKDGLIRTVFVIRSDRPAVLGHFRAWVSETFPDTYEDLLDQPAVLQLDVPIIGLVVTNYNAKTASALIEFADAYVAAGLPSR